MCHTVRNETLYLHLRLPEITFTFKIILCHTVYLRLWLHMHLEKNTQQHRRCTVSQDLREKLWVHGFFLHSCEFTLLILRTSQKKRKKKERKKKGCRVQCKKSVVKPQDLAVVESCSSNFFWQMFMGNGIAYKSIIYLINKHHMYYLHFWPLTLLYWLTYAEWAGKHSGISSTLWQHTCLLRDA